VPAFTDDSLLDRSGTAPAPAVRAVRGGGPAAEIMATDHWRVVKSADRQLDEAYADPDSTGRPRQVDVTVTREIHGTLQILGSALADTTGAGGGAAGTRVVSKSLEEVWTRRIRLRRLPDAPRTPTTWVVTGLSAARSAPGPASFGILNVRMQARGVDTLVTDPQALWSPGQVVAVAPGDSLRITVMPTSPDAIVTRYRPEGRERFQNMGNGTFTLVIPVGAAEAGARVVAIESFAPGTLYDDAAPCDGATWVLGYHAGARPAGDHY
jgi:hypothetical protein